MKKNIDKHFGAAVILLGSALFSLHAQDALIGNGCLAQSDGRGTVSLLWLPSAEKSPLGIWRVENNSGRVLLPRVATGEAQYLSDLDAGKVKMIRQFAQGLPVFKNADERKRFFIGLRVAALASPALARALGLSRTLDHVASGPQRYRIVGLDAAGQPTGVVLSSPAVDAAIATPPPAMPLDFRAVSGTEGVQLFWTPAPHQPLAPVFHYLVDRSGAPGQDASKAIPPILLNENAAPDTPRHVDRAAPVEREITYSLCGVDVFGRRSAPVEAKVLHADHQALLPPGQVAAAIGKGKILLSWEPNPSPNTRLVFVERSYVSAGTYVTLTPKGLPKNARAYEDKTVPGGATAFYRLRSVGPRGIAGAPSVPVSAKARNAAPPPVPRGLKAIVERTRIRLTWEKSETPVALYMLERKTAATGWSRINLDMNQETRFDDPLGEETGGAIFYRLKAVAFDSQESPYCQMIEVTVPERSFPPPPLITSAASRDGKAIVRFVPGLPEERSAGFVVLRGSAPDQPAVVLGRPLAAAAREYADPFVAAGESYWYRVVALNAQGKRSEPSDAVLVTVVAPPVPRPQPPELQMVATPFPQVKITFPQPASGLLAVAERKLATEALWLRLPGATGGSECLDSNPPASGKVLYRVIYLSPNGVSGEPSPPAELVR